MSVKIVFLDFDGTVSTRRVWMGRGDNYFMDPIALEVLNNMCAVSGAKIVCTSTDVTHDDLQSKKFTMLRLAEAGLDIRHIHPDWACRETRGRREPSILDWLARHPEVSRYVILDDSRVDLPNLVRVDPENGILLQHFRRAAKKLGIDMGEVFQEAAKSINVRGQFLLPYEKWHEDFNNGLMKRGNQP